MNNKLKLKVGLNSLKKGQKYLQERNYGRAFAHYLVYFELVDSQRNLHEKDFANTLSIWGKLLEERNRVEDLCKCYLQGLNYFPLNTQILNNFGAILMRIDEFEEAKRYLQLAHNLQPNLLQIEKNLVTVKGTLVERWHFPMLNDYERNMAYYKAILAYSAGNNINALDIGTGCGLLTLFASNNDNIAHINAIESSKIIWEIAQNVFKENNISKVKLHNQHSTELSKNDINGYANLLITEIFDTGLFGEQALETLIHAWENLLHKNATIIPASASLYVTGIESFEILKRYKVINEIKGLEMGDVYLLSNTEAPYECLNLKRTEYRVLTETKKVLDVNFSNLTQLRELESKDNYFGLISLPVVNSGCLHAFAIWFDLHIDANNTITTDPHRDNVKCWEQAVKFVNYPFSCSVGTNIDVKMKCTNGKIEIDPVNENSTCKKCLKVSSDMISLLNDNALISTIEKLYDHTIENKIIVDTNQFPILGLKYAKHNNKCFCTFSNEDDKLLLGHICNINQISPENLIIMEEGELRSLISSRKHKFDIVILDLINKNGTLREKSFLDYILCGNCLNPGGVIYPKRVDLLCQVIESDYLCNFNTVCDENLFGFHIGRHINEYAVNEHFYLEKNFQHKKLSKPMHMGNILMKEVDQSITTCKRCTLQHGKVIDAVLYWFKLVFNDELEIDTSSSTRYNYACFLVDRCRNTDQERREVTLSLKQQEGVIKICCGDYCFVLVLFLQK